MATGILIWGAIAAIIAALISFTTQILIPLLKPMAYADIIEPHPTPPNGVLEISPNEEIEVVLRWRPSFFSQHVERVTVGFEGEQGDNGEAKMIEFFNSLAREQKENGSPWKVYLSENDSLQKEYQGSRIFHAPKSFRLGLWKFITGECDFNEIIENYIRGDGLHTGVLITIPYSNDDHTLFIEVDTLEGSHRTEFTVKKISF